jgi:hypothetical protein
LLYACAATEVLIILLHQRLTVAETYVSTRLEQCIDRDFRSRLFAHAMQLPLAYHENRRAGMMIYVITPGQILLRHSVLMALDAGMHTYDLGLGDQAYKFRLPGRTVTCPTWGLYPLD